MLVSECVDDIALHLASFHLSKCSKVNENELILVRAGIRGLSEEQVAKKTICTMHRHLLGRFWRALRSCQYPGHTGKITSVTGRHVNFHMASEISILFDKTIPVGSFLFLLHAKRSSKRTLTFQFLHLTFHLRCFLNCMALMFVCSLFELAKRVYLFPFFDSRVPQSNLTYFTLALKNNVFKLKSNSMQISTKVRQGSKNKNRSSFAY